MSDELERLTLEISRAKPETTTPENKKQALELARLGVDLKEVKESHKRVGEIHGMRKWGLAALFLLVLGWLGVILLILCLSGYTPSGSDKTVLALSDPVLIALIGSTTVNVVGLFYLAARWLYGQRQNGKN